jgi:hypothetical protein
MNVIAVVIVVETAKMASGSTFLSSERLPKQAHSLTTFLVKSNSKNPDPLIMDANSAPKLFVLAQISNASTKISLGSARFFIAMRRGRTCTSEAHFEKASKFVTLTCIDTRKIAPMRQQTIKSIKLHLYWTYPRNLNKPRPEVRPRL